MGLTFPNAVGLAAGMDKNGQYIDGLASFGFGFIEVGTITPRPQAGSPLPRLFRLNEHNALINRMGLNNQGVDAVVHNISKRKFSGILGINIGKNADTPLERAQDDYIICFEKVYPHADYVTVNISSPNTVGLRDLQHGENVRRLFECLKSAQQQLAAQHGKYKPIVVKISPDMDAEAVDAFADEALNYEIDGIIATNTTNSRDGVEGARWADQKGGLSGAPLCERSTDTIRQLGTRLAGRIPIIGVGGISSAADARAKLEAGATLLQLYSGFIYKGPTLVHELIAAAAKANKKNDSL